MRRITEAEYRAEPGAAIDHAAETGEPVAVIREDGTVRLVISIPRPEPGWR